MRKTFVETDGVVVRSKKIAVCFGLILAGFAAWGESSNMKTISEEKVSLQLQSSFQLRNGDKISLHSFSHKRPQVGGPTSASAYLTLESKKGREDFQLSVSGVEGRPGTTYDRLFLRDREFVLTKWDYDRSVEFLVRTFDVQAGAYGKTFRLKMNGPVALFDDSLKVWLSELGSDLDDHGKRVRFAKVNVLMDNFGGNSVSGKLHENSANQLNSARGGETGLRVAGRMVKLVDLGADGAQISVEKLE